MTQAVDIPYEDVPLGRFHFHLGLSAGGGQFSDGFELGIIGMAIAIAAVPLHLTPVWMGLLGAAALAGLFLGSLLTGLIVDRHGRHSIFAYDMLFMGMISLSQFFATKAWELLALRILLGIVLGADYVVSKSLVTELSPVRFRGRLLSILAIAWPAGYVSSYIIGILLRNVGPDAWHYMLGMSSIPALCIFFFRLGIPESPLWLMKRGRTEEAMAIILKKLGPGVALPSGVIEMRKTGGEWAELFSMKWRKITAVGCVFYACQVAPAFAISTFLPKIMESLHVTSKYTGTVVYNVFIIFGALIGAAIVDRIPRRIFLVVTFYATALLLALLTANVLGSAGIVILFGVYALTLQTACNLEYVYPPELFPTHLRASGVGLAVAGSRFGAVISTFLMPIVVHKWGIGAALGCCVGILAFGGICCQLWAPETRKTRLSTIGEREASLIASKS